MANKFLDCRPSLKTDTQYERNERLKRIVWMAAHGSISSMHRLRRMSDENKRNAWTYSTAETKALLKAVTGYGK